jgi:predicted dehydrogenase
MNLKSPGNGKPKGAIVGFGNIALFGHLPALREVGADIVAVVDICHKRREKARKEGLIAVKSLSELDGFDLDFIDICTPPAFRYEPISFAVQRELDIICEKPVSTPDEIPKIRGLLSDSRVFFYPVHNWKNAPHYVKVKEIVNENGGVKNLHMNTARTHFNRGTPDWNPGWRVDKSISGGGIIMDHGYHNIYLAMHLFGSDFSRAVLDEISFFDANPGVEKRASFSLMFPEERKATITLDWGSDKREIKNTIYECSSKLELHDKRIIKSGDVYEFDESLSGDSVHGKWFVTAFTEFLRNRNTKDKSYFYEAMKVLEGIDSLYRQVGG